MLQFRRKIDHSSSGLDIFEPHETRYWILVNEVQLSVLSMLSMLQQFHAAWIPRLGGVFRNSFFSP